MGVYFPSERRLESLGEELGLGRVLLVTGKTFFETCGAAERLTPLLDERNVLRFSDYTANPTLESLQRLHQLARKVGVDEFSAILAVGGGTTIDLAKLVKAFGLQKEVIADDLSRPLIRPWKIPLLAVPTTAGSGSEATHFAVVYNGDEKHSVADPCLRPDHVLVEPALLQSLPAGSAASGALDAFCQAVESHWSISATDESRSFSKQAAPLAWDSMESFVLKRDDTSASQMARSAYLAGCAINLTKTTAPHAVSYPMTSRYGISHGHAVALMLAALLPFTAGGDTEICQMFGVEGGDALGAASALRRRIDRLGLATDLNDLGLSSEADLEFVLDHGFNPARINNHPRQLTRDVLAEILRPLIRK